jgi:hypothetical protein
LNCSAQEGTANPLSRNLHAAAWFTWFILAATFCWQPHVCFWNFKVFLKLHSQMNATVSSEFTVNVFLQFRCSSKLDDCNQMHFCRYILLAIWTASHPFLEL